MVMGRVGKDRQAAAMESRERMRLSPVDPALWRRSAVKSFLGMVRRSRAVLAGGPCLEEKGGGEETGDGPVRDLEVAREGKIVEAESLTCRDLPG